MEPATTVDVFDGSFKCKNITVHRNATIVKQLVDSAEQRKSLEKMTIMEEKCPIAQRDGI